MILVSTCLLGVNCRYDGGSKQIERLLELAAMGELIPVCPEQLGGCPTPRPPCEICGGSGKDVLEGNARIQSTMGTDISDKFIRGAQETLELAKAFGIQKAVLKARSPSCGFGQIYDGTFSSTLIDGNGVTAELLNRNGIEILSEENFEQK
jgi:uncharacterized protein YbbK (DUF523 family)